MISVDQARQIVVDTFHEKRVPLKTERVDITDALHRVLAQDLCADSDQPPFDRSIKDGFAVRHVDIQQVPVELRVMGESKAGDATLPVVSTGEAVQIMTGAAIPPGADAVVMVEDTEPVEISAAIAREDSFDARRIKIKKSVETGCNISPRGTEAGAGEVLVPRGRKMRFQEISIAASVGVSALEVFCKPVVGILATGDELVDINKTPGQNQIRNSNTYSLHALVQKTQAQARIFGIARDSVQSLGQQIANALRVSDCLLLTGGVSAGKYDFVEPVLKQFGVELYFDSIAIRPGKPAVFGARGNQFVFALPGNPVSAVVTFKMFVDPLLSLLSGEAGASPAVLNAQLENSFKQPTGRRGFLPARFEIREGQMFVKTVPWKGSSDLAGLARSNCFLIAPEEQAEFREGSCVQVLLAD